MQKQMKKHGLDEKQIPRSVRRRCRRSSMSIPENPGVRALERRIASLCRKADREILEKNRKKVQITERNLEKYLDLGDSVSLGGETYVPVERAEQYAKWMIEDALSETERLQEEAAEEALAERNKRIVVT